MIELYSDPCVLLVSGELRGVRGHIEKLGISMEMWRNCYCLSTEGSGLGVGGASGMVAVRHKAIWCPQLYCFLPT